MIQNALILRPFLGREIDAVHSIVTIRSNYQPPPELTLGTATLHSFSINAIEEHANEQHVIRSVSLQNY